MSDRQLPCILGRSILAFLVVFAVLWNGCSEDSPSAPAGDDDIRVQALLVSNSMLAPGESTRVSAWITNRDETPLSGVWVDFGQVGQTQAGTFAPERQVTDTLGFAHAWFHSASDAHGRVDLKAMAGGDIGYAPVFLQTAEASEYRIEVSADEIAMPADGSTTTDITVSVTRNGSAAPNKVVKLTAGELFVDSDRDGVWSAGDALLLDNDDDGEWDALGTISSPVITDESGRATAQFTAGLHEGAVFIKATVDTIHVDLEMTLHSEQSTVTLTIMPREVWADGLTPVRVTARVLDWQGGPLGGKLVRFTAGEPFNDGDGDGYYTPGESYSDENDNDSWDVIGTIESSATTSVSGEVSVDYIAGRAAGTATIRASTRESAAEAQVRLIDLPRVDHALGEWSLDWIYANALSEATLAIALYDVNNTPICGKEIDLSADSGEVTAHATSDANGIATVVYRAPAEAGEASVTGACDGWSQVFPIEVRELPDLLSLRLSSDAVEIGLDGVGGEDRVTLRAACTTMEGEIAPVGMPVQFSIVSGPGGGERFAQSRASSETGLTGDDGIASVVLRSGSLPGIVRVNASSQTVSDVVEIVIADDLTPVVRVISFSADMPEMIVRGEGDRDRSLLTAECYVQPGVRAPAAVPVTFLLLHGPGGGENLTGEPESLTVGTDENGMARTFLFSGTQSGPVDVRACAGGAYANLRLGISAGPPASIVCDASEWFMDEYGFYCLIRAAVRDVYYNPVVDGTVAWFSADEGFVQSESGSGTTQTEGGFAFAHYYPVYEPEGENGHATVSCATDGGVRGEIRLALPYGPDPGEPARIVLTPSVSEIGVAGTGATEQCQLLAACFDDSDVPVHAGHDVTFTILGGPGGGESLEGAGGGPVTVQTDDNGQARVTLQSGTISGTLSVEARAGDEAVSSAMVSIAAGPPLYVSLGVDPLNIRGWDVVGAEAGVSAIISDIHGNPVRDGTTVYFTCDEGIVRGWEGNLGSAATLGGIALGTYFSGEPRLNGLVQITASTAGGGVVGYGGLISSGPPVFVQFIGPAEPVAIVADGEDGCLVTVEVLDINGNFVVADTEVRFRADIGGIDEGALTADGVYGSVAQADYIGEVLGVDHSYTIPDDGVGATVYVQALAGLAGAAGDELEVRLLTGSAYRNNSRINIEASVDAGTTVPFDVEVKDRYGNPLGGHLVTFTATGGGLVSAQATSDAYGMATGLFTAPAVDTACVITAIDQDPGYGNSMILTKRVSITD